MLRILMLTVHEAHEHDENGGACYGPDGHASGYHEPHHSSFTHQTSPFPPRHSD